MPTAFIVASKSSVETEEQKQFAAIAPCIYDAKINPYFEAVSEKNLPVYRDILKGADFAGEGIDNNSIKYSLLIIATRIGDVRADAAIRDLKPKIPTEQADNILKYLEHRYKTSYLKKCFWVPLGYQAEVYPM